MWFAIPMIALILTAIVFAGICVTALQEDCIGIAIASAIVSAGCFTGFFLFMNQENQKHNEHNEQKQVEIQQVFKTIKGPMYVNGHMISVIEYVETKEQFIFSDVGIVKIGNIKE